MRSRSLALLYLVPALLAAQVPNDLIVTRGLDFERQGRYEEAVAAFRQVLAREPANAPALLGVERAYAQLGRRDSVMALARRAVAADAQNGIAWTVEVRTARAMGGEALVAEVLGRWMAAAPASIAPWREMVRTLVATGRLDDAREAVATARTRLNDPAQLRPELASVEIAAGNWARAAAEWRAAVLAEHQLAGAASFNLMAAPAAQRERVTHALIDPDSSAPPRRLAAELLLGWNEPDRAWDILQAVLPGDGPERRTTLQGFADRARAMDGRAPQRVAAEALERLATGLAPAEAARARIESARAYAAAGEQAAARRVLRAMADDAGSSADVARSAATTLVELYARDGNPAEAARLLQQQRDLPGSEAARLGIIVARSWIAAGDLDHADAALGADSSLAAEEVRGWTALYRGAIGLARERLSEAGPAARGGEVGRNVERASMLALLQAVRIDSSPALGAALFLAARGDTAQAARALAVLARAPGTEGQAELLAYAARFTAAAHDAAGAEALWTEIATGHAQSAPAPTALLALARLLAARGDNAAAAQRLESLILDYPASALVPEARRELDRVHGLVPHSS